MRWRLSTSWFTAPPREERTVEGLLFAACAVLEKVSDHGDVPAEGSVEERGGLPPRKTAARGRRSSFCGRSRWIPALRARLLLWVEKSKNIGREHLS